LLPPGVSVLAGGNPAAMVTVLAVTLLVFGVFVGIPLWLAWLSATGRFYRLDRWAEPDQPPSPWARAWPWVFAVTYTVIGVTELARGHRVMAVTNLVFAALWGLVLFPVQLWIWRRRTSQSKAKDGPGASRSPTAGR
jgi:hypothetical protein